MSQDQLGERRDEVYEALMSAHDGLNAAESEALNARLILLMANEIGDADALHALFKAARHAARNG